MRELLQQTVIWEGSDKWHMGDKWHMTVKVRGLVAVCSFHSDPFGSWTYWHTDVTPERVKGDPAQSDRAEFGSDPSQVVSWVLRTEWICEDLYFRVYIYISSSEADLCMVWLKSYISVLIICKHLLINTEQTLHRELPWFCRYFGHNKVN